MKIFLIPLLIAFALNAIADFFIYNQLKGVSFAKKTLQRIHIALSLTLGAIVVAAAVAPVSLLDTTAKSFVIYGYSVILAAKIVYTLLALVARALPKGICRSIAHAFAVAVGLCTIGSAIYATFHTRYDIDVKQVEIEFSNLPAGFDGYRIAQFSDFHVGTLGTDTTFVHQVVQAINSQNPHLICFTGDLVNSSSAEAAPFVQCLSHLSAPDGVISILGNHDYGDYHRWNNDREKAADRLNLINSEKAAGWNVLLNQTATIHRNNDSIKVIGVENIGEPPFHVYGNLRQAYPSLNDSCFKVLLSHNPTHWKQQVEPESNINLMLAGHTHAMQITVDLFGKTLSPSSLRYDEWKGLYGNTHGQWLYVNIGIGCIGMPARFGAKPEITIITLKRKE
ncbi:MAG: metallophosphoesterase [Muribaculaceae bacterium]